MMNSQQHIDPYYYTQLQDDLHELAKYHSDPNGFLAGHFMSHIMRFREDSSFYQQLHFEKQRLNVPKPYVGLHVRRSDKSNEALFYEVEEYMVYVEEFFETYFLKHPEKSKQHRASRIRGQR